MHLPQRSTKAFTLIELIVVIVILGILALIAIPTFAKVIGKSQDSSTLTTLRAVGRDTQALRALDQAPAWGTLPEAAIGETTQAVSAGLQAAGALKAVVDDGTRNPVAGEVSYKVVGDGLVLSMLSGSKRVCVVGLSLTSMSPGTCLEPGKDTKGAATTSSTATVLSSGADSIIPAGTSSGGGSSSGPVLALPAGKTISAGYGTTCVADVDGTAKCTGWNNMGQVGDGTQQDAYTFKAVTGLSGVSQVASGTYNSCAVLTDTTVKCWGLVGINNASYSLGNGVSGVGSATPVAVKDLTGVKQVALGQGQSCALLADGTVKCWGLGATGQLGQGSNASSNVPVAVKDLTGVSMIASGSGNTCALKSGTVWCWGPTANNGNSTAAPLQVPGITTATQVASNNSQSCAILTGGAVKCWGQNSFWQLGDESAANPTWTPVTVLGVPDAVSIAMGNSHVCAARASKTVTCWGYNVYGQTGNSSMTTATTRYTLPLSNVIAVTANGFGTIATTEVNGVRKAYGWGMSDYGAFGYAPAAPTNVPKEMTSF